MNTSSSHPISRDSIPSAIATLTDSTNLLKSFTHRNKNQHASSHWFSHLSILRRNLSRLQHDLSALQAEIPNLSTSQNSKPQRPDAKQNARVKRATQAEARVIKRATWIRDSVVPRSYVVFTQLMADNQHSALGLFLLSLLAKVNTLLVSLSPSTEQKPQPQSSSQHPVTSDPSESVRYSALQGDPEHPRDKDRGEAVARDHLPSILKPAKGKQPKSGTDAVPPGGLAAVSKTSPSAQKKEEALRGAPERAKSKTSKSGEATKKDSDKKKRKKMGDEFSSLFGSL